MTLKIKGATQNIEINVPLDESFPKEPTVLPTLPNEIMSELEKLNLKIKTPMLIQKIGTQRYEVKTQDGLLVLDKTTFLKDIVVFIWLSLLWSLPKVALVRRPLLPIWPLCWPIWASEC